MTFGVYFLTLVIQIHVLCSFIDSFTLVAYASLCMREPDVWSSPDILSGRWPPPPAQSPRRAAHGGEDLTPTGYRRASGCLCPCLRWLALARVPVR
ncbi:hypothetical protein BDA96_04G343400 [Sorghum bicolor]|uniref:Uncharacterized protein n=2 Tax=Sorghum bicolor TaxID=4558 RepID=A0A921R8S8_SORBI|nr:hypothetical protein BDA96_04G343400 [Sorghum bicolor]KXG31230.1 hypothetical protein SORBI_3004G320900 [Sorghum bicolor]